MNSYDLAGIDPIRNPGVYRFKRETGASPIEYLGEWDWATSSSLQWFGNWSIAKRDLLKRVEAVLKTSRAPRSWVKTRVFKSAKESEPEISFGARKPLTLKS